MTNENTYTNEHNDGIMRILNRNGFWDNPFAVKNAEQEETSLPDYFIARPFFFRLLGSPEQFTTSIYFAKRGNGKTAMRYMVKYRLQNSPRFVPTLFVDFDRKQFYELDNIYKETGSISSEYCRSKLLNLAKTALDEQKESLTKTFPEFNSEVGPELDSLGDLVRELRQAGLRGVCISIDGLDEIPSTVADLEKSEKLILPLLSDLVLLETPYISFKFFLPLEVRDLLYDSGLVRFDRFETLNEETSWGKAELLELLRLRLRYYHNSRREDVNLAEMCEDTAIVDEIIRQAVGSPRFLIILCNNLFQKQASLDPNRNITWEAYDIVINNRKYLLSQGLKAYGLVDPDSSTEDLIPEAPAEFFTGPKLRRVGKKENLSIHGMDVFIGGRRLETPPAGLEFKLLKALYDRRGDTCSKDDLIDLVYKGEAASDEQLQATIRRLRRKLGNGDYIQSVRSSGYLLQNYEDPPAKA